MGDATEREVLFDRTMPEPNSGCWLWMGYCNPDGYGKIRGADGKQRNAHRVFYEAFRGPIPEGLQVLHKCDNPPCCNPDHLFPGTNLDNVRDRDRKGRQRVPRGAASPNAKLTDGDVVEIRRRVLAGERRCRVATAFGIDRSAVYHIMIGNTWRHVPTIAALDRIRGESANAKPD